MQVGCAQGGSRSTSTLPGFLHLSSIAAPLQNLSPPSCLPLRGCFILPTVSTHTARRKYVDRVAREKKPGSSPQQAHFDALGQRFIIPLSRPVRPGQPPSQRRAPPLISLSFISSSSPTHLLWRLLCCPTLHGNATRSCARDRLRPQPGALPSYLGRPSIRSITHSDKRESSRCLDGTGFLLPAAHLQLGPDFPRSSRPRGSTHRTIPSCQTDGRTAVCGWTGWSRRHLDSD